MSRFKNTKFGLIKDIYKNEIFISKEGHSWTQILCTMAN